VPQQLDFSDIESLINVNKRTFKGSQALAIGLGFVASIMFFSSSPFKMITSAIAIVVFVVLVLSFASKKHNYMSECIKSGCYSAYWVKIDECYYYKTYDSEDPDLYYGRCGNYIISLKHNTELSFLEEILVVEYWGAGREPFWIFYDSDTVINATNSLKRHVHM
jgi:hypothetical protein